MDTLAFIDESVLKEVISREHLLPDGVDAVRCQASLKGGSRLDYLRLLVAHLRSRKVGLSWRAKAHGGVLAVSKSKGKQREIWHGGEISAMVDKPP